MIRLMFEALTMKMELEFTSGLKSYSEKQPGPIARASACTGCDVKAKVCSVVESFVSSTFGVNIKSQNVMRAEKNQHKQKFLQQMFGPDISFLVGDMALLQRDSAWNIVSHTETSIPFFTSLDIGFPCTSRTPLSSKCRENLNCCQKNSAATGQACNLIFGIVDKNWPDEITMECVTTLNQIGDGCTTSDADFITDTLKSKGYWAAHFTMQAADHGSPVPRERLWWVALKGIKSDIHNEVSKHFLDLVNSLRSPSQSDAERARAFVILSKAERRRVARMLGLPSYSDIGSFVSKSAKEDMQYKTDHHKAFKRAGLEWPVFWETVESAAQPEGLLPREREVVHFLCTVFPFDASDSFVEFVDVNPTLAFILGQLGKDVDEDAPLKNPWRPHSPTLVGSSKIVVRYVCPFQGIVIARALEPVEYLKAIGWSESFCANWLFTDPGEIQNWTPQTYGLLIANLAGNAWSGYSYAAIHLSLLATAGKYHSEQFDVQPETPRPEGDEGDAQPGSLSGSEKGADSSESESDSGTTTLDPQQ